MEPESPGDIAKAEDDGAVAGRSPESGVPGGRGVCMPMGIAMGVEALGDAAGGAGFASGEGVNIRDGGVFAVGGLAPSRAEGSSPTDMGEAANVTSALRPTRKIV